MNKLMGFFELKHSNLPSVDWKEFTENSYFDPQYLWTVRTAVDKGNDLNLPRLVGVPANEAYNKALDLYQFYKDKGMIIYYPYFIAEKSGTLEISESRIVLEAVEHDLWNLVTDNKKNITIIETEDNIEYDGDREFLSISEIKKLKKYIRQIKCLFREELIQGKSILLEWSFAYNTDIQKKCKDDKYLVFYEIRTI